MRTVVFTCMDVYNGCMFCTIFVAVVMCSATQKGQLWSYSLQYNWRVGWEGEGFCKCQDREGLQHRNLNYPGGREGMEVTVLRFVKFSWGLMGSGHADGAWGEGRLLSAPFLPTWVTSFSLGYWNLERTKSLCRFFVFLISSLCNILKSWKILWNSSVYRAQVKT